MPQCASCIGRELFHETFVPGGCVYKTMAITFKKIKDRHDVEIDTHDKQVASLYWWEPACPLYLHGWAQV